MNKFTIALIVGVLLTQAKAKEVQGDAKVACEVILCLSTGTRPSECTAPLKRFFQSKPKSRGSYYN